jgi:regulation of enolase protein 1 (concanavalin A-like superfamily)
MDWYNEPPTWNEQGNTITVTSAPKTDFWRKTHSGAIKTTAISTTSRSRAISLRK